MSEAELAVKMQRERVIRWHDPRLSVEMSRGLTGLQILNAIRDGAIPPPPFAALLNVRLAEVEERRVVFEADPAEEHYNPAGVVHGGFAMALLDFALGSAVNSVLPADRGYGTIDVNVRLVRPITKDTGTVRCEGTLVTISRTLATSEGRIVDREGKILATGTSACVLMSRPL
jgi:uncharacterized protein (TIGR00369 family)